MGSAMIHQMSAERANADVSKLTIQRLKDGMVEEMDEAPSMIVVKSRSLPLVSKTQEPNLGT